MLVNLIPLHLLEYINEIISGSSRHVFSTVDDNYLLLRNLRLNR